jgi:hypothetical protein
MNPSTEETLEENVRRKILEVSKEEIFRMNSNLRKRHTVCVCAREQKQHFQCFL